MIAWALDYHVDHARRDVAVTLAGFGHSRAVYREGFGCHLDHGDEVDDFVSPAAAGGSSDALLPPIAGSMPVAPATPRLGAALDHAFAEPDAPPFRRTKAVVVVKGGHVVAEHYADGYGADPATGRRAN